MKPIPANIIASGPLGTVWFGGPVDRSKMTLRITGANVDKNEVSSLLGHAPKPGKAKHWSLSAPESKDADLDAQVQWLFAHVTSDLAVWKKLRATYQADLFCGLFLERSNRGVDLSAETLAAIAARGIGLSFDIYAPDEKPT